MGKGTKGKDIEEQEITEDYVDKSTTQERGAWGNQLEFILTCVGYAVGLGNVWRFPYLCYRNGGGAFLIPYFIMLGLVGIPLFFLELAFGQFASLGPIAIWTVSPLFKGLGICSVVVNTIIAIYYNVIIAWAIYYFFLSMRSNLGWQDCNNSWNTEFCFTSDQLKNFNASTEANGTMITIGNLTLARSQLKTPSEEFFYRQVLRITDGIDEMGEIRWEIAACLLGAWIIVFLVLSKGISSLGKVVYFSSIFPYVLLTVMLIRGVTLPGSGNGIRYYLNPDFSRLSDARVWSDAATQIFYSLSACTGGLTAMASYNQFKNNCLRDSLLVPLINCGTSFYAGFVIFSVLGFMAHEKGVSVDDVAESGPGLVFVVYPEALTQMPIPQLWSVLFFFMLVTLGFSSEFSMTECFFSSVTDEFPQIFRKTRARNIAFRVIACLVFFVLSIPMLTQAGFYVFNLIDVYVGGFPLLFVGLFECIALTWVYGYTNFAEDIKLMLDRKPNIFFRVTWIVVSPVLMLGIIVFMCIQHKPLTLDEYVYPAFANGIGWIVVIASLIWMPGVMVYRLLKDGGWMVLKSIAKPTAEWGPQDKEGRERFRSSRVNQTVQIATVPTVYSSNGANGSFSPNVYENTAFTNDDVTYTTMKQYEKNWNDYADLKLADNNIEDRDNQPKGRDSSSQPIERVLRNQARPDVSSL